MRAWDRLIFNVALRMSSTLQDEEACTTWTRIRPAVSQHFSDRIAGLTVDFLGRYYCDKLQLHTGGGAASDDVTSFVERVLALPYPYTSDALAYTKEAMALHGCDILAHGDAMFGNLAMVYSPPA
jgi:hypothetical protein